MFSLVAETSPSMLPDILESVGPRCNQVYGYGGCGFSSDKANKHVRTNPTFGLIAAAFSRPFARFAF